MQSFRKHQDFSVRRSAPFNGGPPLGLLRETFVTPQESFFVRNNGDVPVIDCRAYRLIVTGLVKRPVVISLSTIRHLFSKVTVTATLPCAGNRRDGLNRIKLVGGETHWGAEAVGTAEWGGVPLGEVLDYAGLKFGARHVAFTGLDDVGGDSRETHFGGSIPVEKAMGPEVLLAYEMNEEPLTPEQGAPLRLVVPGDIGARSVKWLGEIRLLASPSKNYFRRFADKLFNRAQHRVQVFDVDSVAKRLEQLGQAESWQANF